MNRKIIVYCCFATLLLFGCYIIWTIISRKDIELVNLHKLELSYPIDDFIVNHDSLLYSNEHGIYSYSIENRIQERILALNESERVTFTENEYICLWENFSINTKDEIATKIDVRKYQKGQKMVIIEKDSFLSNYTIRPLKCNSSEILAEDFYPNSIGRHYKIDLKSNQITEIDLQDKTGLSQQSEITIIEEINGIIIEYNGNIYHLSYPNIFENITPTNRGFLLMDQTRDLWHVEIPSSRD